MTAPVSLDLDLQIVCGDADIPGKPLFRDWVHAALAAAAPERKEAQIAIRVVDADEGADLNYRWRHKEGPTNVLSFAMDGLDLIAPAVLGDIVICAPVVKREAEAQEKALISHWAHMTIHGVLHLLGFDHIEDDQAEEMEALEIKILQQLGYTDPYQPHE